MVFDKRGRYRIHAVVSATGVSAPTLRSWERRYGVPSPERTASAYRLYSDDDIALIARMRDLTNNGIAAAEAAHAVRTSLPPPMAAAVDPFDDARDQVVRATEAFDPSAVEHAVLRSFTLADATTVYDRVLAPAMAAVGDALARGDISIAQECVALDAVSSILRDLLRLMQPADASRAVVLGCFAGDHQLVSLYGLGLHFAGWGYRAVCLGPDCPPIAIADSVNKLKPDAVGLSLATTLQADTMRVLVSDYAEACGMTPWLVAGPAAGAIREDVVTSGGVVASDDLTGVRPMLERVLRQNARSN